MAGDSPEPFEKTQEAENDLDPRIQIELEALNNATDDINKLETELDESNTTFRMLHNESTRRLKILNRQLGSCIERARPYYEALEIAKQAQQECQKAAVKFQRANEIHQAAKETVALAEARFLSKQHEWEFDSAWQDMLNNAIIKVTDAENQKSESGREHQKKATLFTAAETKVQLLEHRLKRAIVKSRPYFEEKALCEGQLSTQKTRVLQLRDAVKEAKARYAASLRRLEDISEEIHMRRRRESTCESPPGPREPGVGAELTTFPHSELTTFPHSELTTFPHCESHGYHGDHDTHSLDVDFDLDKCDATSMCSSVTNGSRMSYDSGDESSSSGMNAEDLEKLRIRVRELAATPVAGWHSEAQDHSNENINSKDQVPVTSPCGSREPSSNPFSTRNQKSDSQILLSPMKHVQSSLNNVKHVPSSPTNDKHVQSSLSNVKHVPSSPTNEKHVQSSLSNAKHVPSSLTNEKHVQSSLSNVKHVPSSLTNEKHVQSSLSNVKHVPSSLTNEKYVHGEPMKEKQTFSPVDTTSKMLQPSSLSSSPFQKYSNITLQNVANPLGNISSIASSSIQKPALNINPSEKCNGSSIQKPSLYTNPSEKCNGSSIQKSALNTDPSEKCNSSSIQKSALNTNPSEKCNSSTIQKSALNTNPSEKCNSSSIQKSALNTNPSEKCNSSSIQKSALNTNPSEKCNSSSIQKSALNTNSSEKCNSSSIQKSALNTNPSEKCNSSSIQNVGSNICKQLQNTIDHPLRSLVDSTARSFTSK